MKFKKKKKPATDLTKNSLFKEYLVIVKDTETGKEVSATYMIRRASKIKISVDG